MKVDARELLKSAGLEAESFYPGKHLVKKYIVHGEHKSHCVSFSWHDSIRVELKAGLTGKNLDPKEMRLYAVSFQAPTYLEIETDETDEEESSSASGKGGGGGKKPAQRKQEDAALTSMNAFSKTADGAVSTVGEIKKFVIMGREIAKEAYEQAFSNLKQQLSQAKVMAMELMQGVTDIIHKATPGGGLSARGDETIKYKYDAERTAPMFGGLTPT